MRTYTTYDATVDGRIYNYIIIIYIIYRKFRSSERLGWLAPARKLYAHCLFRYYSFHVERSRFRKNDIFIFRLWSRWHRSVVAGDKRTHQTKYTVTLAALARRGFITGDFRKIKSYCNLAQAYILRPGPLALYTLEAQEVTTKGVYRLPYDIYYCS